MNHENIVAWQKEHTSHMSKPDWHRVSREQASAILKKIGSQADSAIFSEQMTEITWSYLPFYSRYRLFRLTNYATLPCFTMDYLGNEEEGVFYALDGLANTIYTVNDCEPVKLTADTVVAYLDFFFSQVRGPDGDIYLIKQPNDLPMLSSLPSNQQKSVLDTHKPLIIDADIIPGEFNINGTLYYDGSLISAVIRVAPTGKLSIHDQMPLLQGIHFPMSPVEYTYMGESQ